jgi:S1-C subfamily serine protease
VTGRLAVAVVAGSLLGPVPAVAQDPGADEWSAAVARPAVVVVEVRWHGWVRDPRTDELFGGAEGYQVTSSCTGFAVHADGHLVTAGHCVDPGPEGAGELMFDLAARELVAVGRAGEAGAAAAELAEHAVLEGATEGSPVRRDVLVHRGVAYDGETHDDTPPAEVVDIAPVSEGDVAVLAVARGRLPALALAGGDGPPVGTPVLAIGYPGSADRISDPTLEPSVKDGLVSNRRTVDGVPFYEVSAAATGGMSGGPVVDQTGQVIGLVSHGPAGESQAFNFVASASSITAVLDRTGVPYGLGPIDHNFRAGLERYLAGRPAAAIAYLDAVIEASPAHLQAVELRRLAAQADPEQPAGSGAGPAVWWAITAGAVAVLAALAAGTGLLVRLSSPPVTPPPGVAAAAPPGPA